jgi:hypothetical protein
LAQENKWLSRSEEPMIPPNLSERIAELEQKVARCEETMSVNGPGTILYDEAWNRKMVLRSELSRLRNEQPKGACDCPQCVDQRAFRAPIATSPGPGDVRDALEEAAFAIDEYFDNDGDRRGIPGLLDSARKKVRAAFLALSQSDACGSSDSCRAFAETAIEQRQGNLYRGQEEAQPVGWRYRFKELEKIEWHFLQNAKVAKDFQQQPNVYVVEPLYTTPLSHPDARLLRNALPYVKDACQDEDERWQRLIVDIEDALSGHLPLGTSTTAIVEKLYLALDYAQASLEEEIGNGEPHATEPLRLIHKRMITALEDYERIQRKVHETSAKILRSRATDRTAP